jgi:hypothetical protein
LPPARSRGPVAHVPQIAQMPIGFLLNWNVTLMKNGIKRMIIDL